MVAVLRWALPARHSKGACGWRLRVHTRYGGHQLPHEPTAAELAVAQSALDSVAHAGEQMTKTAPPL